jgi:retron-type reverse transcriptase
VLDQAFHDVCAQRAAAHPDDDIWHLRRAWPAARAALQQALRDGTYTFSPPRLVSLSLPSKPEPELVERWSAQDTLVLKAMAQVLGAHCAPSVPSSVTSLRHRGGPKGAVRKVCHHLRRSPGLTRVLRTDVKSYYRSIDHVRLQHVLSDVVHEPGMRSLLWQAIDRCVDQNAQLCAVERGISKGSPLSPILGALYLTALDEAMEKLHTQGGAIVYIRYVDDILVLADSPRSFRKAIRVLNQHLSAAGLEKHPDKTSIGKIEKGFDFLGYHFAGRDGRVTVARQQQEQFIARIHRLYETSTSTPPAAPKGRGLHAAERRAHPWLNEDVLADHGEATVREALREEGPAAQAARPLARRPLPPRRRPAAPRRWPGWPGGPEVWCSTCGAT